MAREFKDSVTSRKKYAINPHKVVVGNNYSRHEVRQQDVDDLYDSIKRYGQRNPIGCRVDKDGVVHLISGEHRLQAVRRLWDEDTRPEADRIRIEFNIENGDPLIACIDENLRRKDITIVDRAKMAHELKETGRKNEEIAQVLRCSIPQVGNYLRVYDAPEAVKKAATEGLINTTETILIAKSKKPLELLAKAVEEGEEVATAIRKSGGKHRRSVADLMKICKDYPEAPLAKELTAFFKGEKNDLESFVGFFPDPDSGESNLPVAVEVVEVADEWEAEPDPVYFAEEVVDFDDIDAEFNADKSIAVPFEVLSVEETDPAVV